MKIISMKKTIQCIALILSVISVSACDLANNMTEMDREGSNSFQDYRDAFAPRDPELEDGGINFDSSIPSLDPLVADSQNDVKPVPIVSISVNGSVPLRDILFELAEQADYDLELDPNIRGSIIFRAQDRPFDQVVERISDVAGLRFRFKDDVMRVEVDNPYNKIYKIDYLNYIRSNSGSIRNDIAVVSGEEADTGSEFEAASESEADFWAELETNVTQLIGNARFPAMVTGGTPVIAVADQIPQVAPLAPEGADNISPPDATLTIETLPIDGDGEEEFGDGENLNTFAMNRHAGLISVFAPDFVHKQVEEYLRAVKKSVTSQVLIEAKILEVTLSDQFSAGIDWNAVDIFGDGRGLLEYGTQASAVAGVGAVSAATIPASDTFSPTSSFVAGYLGTDIEALVQMIQGFGTVKALASPRITVLNNQSAVMNIATNQVFFELDVDSEVDDDTGDVTLEIDTEIRNVPEGVLVNVLPSIDLENETISIALRPTITRIVGFESDPAISILTSNAIESLIPELNVQEIDTVVKARSGQPIVLGGLLQDRVESTEEGVPVLSELPVMGNVFKNRIDLIQKTELVVLLKATIVEGDDTIHSTDKDFYRKFSGDRRPFKL